MTQSSIRIALWSFAFFTCTACSQPTPGPDKTIAGAVLGAGWGAGAGAVVGNQVSTPGKGIGMGAGFGAVDGALIGAGFDELDSVQVQQEEQLAALRIQNVTNSRQIEQIQAKLDRATPTNIPGGVYQVPFDQGATSMRAGTTANLEILAEQLRVSPGAFTINVIGHSDDGGTPDDNQRVAEARARTVAGYLASRGINSDQIVVKSYGSTRPVASNIDEQGRQANRRVEISVSK